MWLSFQDRYVLETWRKEGTSIKTFLCCSFSQWVTLNHRKLKQICFNSYQKWLLYYSESLIKDANVIKGEVKLKNEDSSAGRHLISICWGSAVVVAASLSLILCPEQQHFYFFLFKLYENSMQRENTDPAVYLTAIFKLHLMTWQMVCNICENDFKGFAQ